MAQDSHDKAQSGQTGTDLLASATAAARTGHVRHARSLLKLLVRQSPDNAQAWLELAHLYEIEPAPDPDRVQDCLRQVLRIDPHHRIARSKLHQLQTRPIIPEHTRTVTDQPEPERTPNRSTLYSTLGARGIYLLGACALVLVSTLVVLGWAVQGARPILATRTPTLTYTPLPTATPTATPTPSIPDRVALQIPLLEQDWHDRDWPAAINRLAHISMLDSSYPGLHTARCDTYVHWAQDLEAQCQIKRAYDLYRRAAEFCQDRDDLLQQKAEALLYLSGKWSYDRERWPQAVTSLQELYDARPDYATGCQEPLAEAGDETGPSPLALDARTLLHASLVASSRQYLEQNELKQALQAAQAALELQPDAPDVIQLLNTIQLKLRPPPTPTPKPQPLPSTGKRIEVNISQQRMYVWQGDTLLYNWVCSTGKSGSGTAAGQFRVQSKIPEAWGGQWSLRMPYWLGIYWAGSIENGIHALPIMANGQTLWAGYLGTPVSFGCIILSTENARTLYHWAEIGTPVSIHY